MILRLVKMEFECERYDYSKLERSSSKREDCVAILTLNQVLNMIQTELEIFVLEEVVEL